MNLFEAAYLDDLSDVPFHLRGQVKRARDARHYADITMPKVGDLVTINYGHHPGKPGTPQHGDKNGILWSPTEKPAARE